MNKSTPRLIAHILYRFDVGGLENGVVNLINRIPNDRFHHVIISLTDATDFKKRIKNPNVDIFCLHKKPGQDFAYLWRLWKLLRKLKPSITHTRNLAALETVVIAFLAGVPRRVHSEHGWGMADLHGTNRKYRMLRKGMSLLVHRYIGLSKHIETYLHEDVGIPKAKLTQLYNGVDEARFSAESNKETQKNLFPSGFISANSIVIGTVGRMEPVKDQLALANAFIRLYELSGSKRSKLRLVIIGDGELRAPILQRLQDAGISAQAWLPGSHDQVPAIMQAMDIFVLPSRNEGISNTILEAMASGLPIVATRVGGNPELVVENETGVLVPPDDPTALASALLKYVNNPDQRSTQGRAGRARIEQHFRLEHMVDKYLSVYDSLF